MAGIVGICLARVDAVHPGRKGRREPALGGRVGQPAEVTETPARRFDLSRCGGIKGRNLAYLYMFQTVCHVALVPQCNLYAKQERINMIHITSFSKQELNGALAGQLPPGRHFQLQPAAEAGLHALRVRLHALRRRRQRPLRHQGPSINDIRILT